jgi:hypothetical protein
MGGVDITNASFKQLCAWAMMLGKAERGVYG